MRGRVVVVGTVVLVAVLGGLMTLVLVAVDGTASRTRAVERSVRALSAYQDVQRAIAAEAFAEAGYRRAPSPASRRRVEQAASALDGSVAAVRALGSRRDDGAINYLLVLNARYEAEVRADLRRGSAAAATSVDDRVAGPALDAMQQLVDAAVSRRQRVADGALAEQGELTRQLRVLGPAALAVAVLVVGLCWAVIVGQQRRLHGRAQASEHRARHDPLTGVGNRALLTDELQGVLAQPAPDAALLLIDLDGFKQVNDQHGHVTGDEVLRAVAGRLQRACGPSDLVCRMGGDEFALLVRPAGRVEQVRTDVAAALVHSVELASGRLWTSGSVGAAVLRRGMDERSALTEADESLYAAKRAGRIPAPRGGPAGEVLTPSDVR